jgi:hypothetical protein
LKVNIYKNSSLPDNNVFKLKKDEKIVEKSLWKLKTRLHLQPLKEKRSSLMGRALSSVKVI